MPNGLVNALSGIGVDPDPTTGLLMVDFRRRNLELGERKVRTENNTKHVVGGFEGELMGWRWDTAYNWGRTDATTISSGLLSKSHLQLALGDPAACTQLSEIGCVQANIFGSALAGSITPAMRAWISPTVTEDARAVTQTFTIDLANDDIMELPGGHLGAAAGFEYRNESLSIEPDTMSSSFNTIGSTNQLPTHGSRNSSEFYMEAVGSTLDMLEIDVAFRFSHYSDFGNTTNPKISGVFTPEDYVPGLRVRGSWGQGFRAPNLVELFFGGQENFGTFNDPCSTANYVNLPGCNGQQSDPSLIQFLALAGGNSNLKPEESETWTLGFTYEPDLSSWVAADINKWLDGISTSFDYYDTQVDNAIVANSQFIIDLAAQGNPAFLPLVERNANGNIGVIRGGFLNLAARSTKGFDYKLSYLLPDWDWGQLKFTFSGNYVVEFLDQPDPTSPAVDISGIFIDAAGDGLGSIPKVKFNFGTLWNRGPYMLSLIVHYVDSLDETDFLGGSVVNTMDSWTTVDIQGSYTYEGFGAETTLTMGVENLGDEDPPIATTSFNDNIDGRTHDLIGRFWYMRLAVAF